MEKQVRALRAIRLHARDNVATAVTELAAGAKVWLDDKDTPVEVIQNIAFGHKFALNDISGGDNVYKYGVTIGVATNEIRTGEHVHLHNLRSLQKKGVQRNAGISQGEWKNRNT